MIEQTPGWARILLAVGVLSLAGCATDAKKLGMSDAQWRELPRAKRAKLRLAHSRIQRDLAAKRQHYQHDVGKEIFVEISGGTAEMWPYKQSQKFKPVQFAIHQHECLQVPVESAEGRGQTQLGVCYYDHILHLDPSAYEVDKEEGSRQFFKTGLWTAGFTYPHLHTEGLVRFNDAKMHVQQPS